MQNLKKTINMLKNKLKLCKYQIIQPTETNLELEHIFIECINLVKKYIIEGKKDQLVLPISKCLSRSNSAARVRPKIKTLNLNSSIVVKCYKKDSIFKSLENNDSMVFLNNINQCKNTNKLYNRL